MASVLLAGGVSALAYASGWAVALQQASPVQRGYVWMFVLMAATPYLLLLVIGGGLFRAIRRQRERAVKEALEDQKAWEASRSSPEGIATIRREGSP